MNGRRLRLTGLLLGLLLVAPSAADACGWVLWREDQVVMSMPSREWAAPVAYPDRAACVSVITKNVNAWREGQSANQEVRPASTGTTAEFFTWGKDRTRYTVVRLICLPDTIDPRPREARQ